MLFFFNTISKISNDLMFWNCPIVQLIVKMVDCSIILGEIGNNKPLNFFVDKQSA